MVFFLHKKRAPQIQQTPQQSASAIPVYAVQQLAARGLSEAEIISKLRGQGFMPAQIDSALTQALKAEVGAPQPQMRQRIPVSFPATTSTQTVQEPQRFAPPEKITTSLPQEALTFFQQPQEEQQPQFTFEEPPKEFITKSELQPEITLEEVIEGVVAERWSVFEERLNKFEQQEARLQEQIDALRGEIEDVKKMTFESKQALSGKFDEFSTSVSTIESRIGGIEKAFKSFLPELTSNVRTMTELVEKMKK